MSFALGGTICFLSLIFVIRALYGYFAGKIKVAGWTTLALVLAFSSGMILLALGIIGEYLVRILREVRGGPQHVERETLGFPD